MQYLNGQRRWLAGWPRTWRLPGWTLIFPCYLCAGPLLKIFLPLLMESWSGSCHAWRCFYLPHGHRYGQSEKRERDSGRVREKKRGAEAAAEKPQPQRHIDATTRNAPLPDSATTARPCSCPNPSPSPSPSLSLSPSHWLQCNIILSPCSFWRLLHRGRFLGCCLIFQLVSVWFLCCLRARLASPRNASPRNASPCSLSLYLCRSILAAPCCCYWSGFKFPDRYFNPSRQKALAAPI